MEIESPRKLTYLSIVSCLIIMRVDDSLFKKKPKGITKD